MKSGIIFFAVKDKGCQIMDLPYFFTLFDQICFQPFLNSLLAVETGLAFESFLLSKCLCCNKVAITLFNSLLHYLAHISPSHPSIFS